MNFDHAITEFRRYLWRNNRSENTIDSYISIIKSLLIDKNLDTLTQKDLDDIAYQLREEYKYAGNRLRYAAINVFCREILKRENIQILARDKVPDALQDKYRGHLLFGVFIGVPYDKRSMFNIQMEPTRIELYKNSFEKAFSSKWDMEEQIVKTVIHEIGHFFGFSEKDLRQRNY